MEEEKIVPTGDINADFSGNTEIELTTKSVTPGLNRQDKSVTITDENGLVQKSSSIMMGYNKSGIVLGDGSFITEEDVEQAIQEELAKQEPGTIIVNRHTLAEIDFDEFFDLIKQAAGAIIVGGRSPKITNQDSRTWGVLGNNGETVSKGVAFLGNRGVQLKPGVYVNLEEVKKAMEDYVFAKKEENKIVARVVKKHKTSLLPLLLSLVIVVTGGIRITDDIREEVRRHIVEKESISQVVDYDVHQQRKILEESDEAIDRIIDEVTMGEKLPVRDGEEFNVNSLETGTSKTMGEEFTLEGKEAGDYQVTGFSIVVNGEIIEFKEDFDGLDNQTKLKEFIEETLKKHNLTIDEIEVKIHLGVNGDYTRLGWIDITDLINKDTITKDMLQEKIKDVSVDSGVINDFTGDSITLLDGTTIKIVDTNGDFLKPGTKVIGSDNKEYTIEKLEVEEVKKTILTEENVVEEVVVGKKIVWQINNLALAASLLPALFVAVNAINNYRKNKKSNQEPELFEFENEEQYQDFKVEFRKAKNKYENGSKFGRVMKRIFIGRRVDIMQRLTNEQAKDIYASIKRHAGRDFVFGPNDKIKMKEGKIYIYYADDHILDITDIVMADIATIGSHNPKAAEGYLDKDKDKGENEDGKDGNNRK